MQYFDIFLFALIAVFLVLRLRGVLGRRTGNEKQNQSDVFGRQKHEDNGSTAQNGAAPQTDNVYRLPDSENADAQSDVPSGTFATLQKIQKADPSFTQQDFLNGEGDVVSGDPNQVVEAEDLWTFARNTQNNDPNWQLVATETPEDEPSE